MLRLTKKLHILELTFIACLNILSFTVESNSFTEGQVLEVNSNYIFSDMTAEAVENWHWEFEKNGTEYLRLQLSLNSEIATPEFSLIIFDRTGNRVIDTITNEDFTSDSMIWTDVYFEDYVQLRLQTIHDMGGVELSIDAVAFQVTSAAPYSVTKPDEREEIRIFKAAVPDLYRLGEAVVKMMFVRGDRAETCTGFLVARDMILTNAHCVSDTSVCSTTVVKFDYKKLPAGEEDRSFSDRCHSIVKVDDSLDYSLIRLKNPVTLPRHFITLPGRTPTLHEQVFMIQHPAGQDMQVSRKGCFVNTAGDGHDGLGDDFGHRCDTLGGSSGSPMFGRNLDLIGLHHLGFDSESNRWKAENRAVKIDHIWEGIKEHFPHPDGADEEVHSND